MKAAIVTLQITLSTLINNEAINRAEGNTEQADLEAQNAAEISEALTLLTQHAAGASSMDDVSMRFNVLSMANTPAFTADEVVKRAGCFLDFVKDKRADVAQA